VAEFIYPRFRENKPKTLVFSHRKRAYWACFRENCVYNFGHCTVLASQAAPPPSRAQSVSLSTYRGMLGAFMWTERAILQLEHKRIGQQAGRLNLILYF
jgi:hypothetical protein